MRAKHIVLKQNLSKLLFFLAVIMTGHLSAQGQCAANASFSSTLTVCSTVQFTDLSTAAPFYFIVAWDWDFGDGNTSTLQNPLHIFVPGSTYNVTLTITVDSSGVSCTDNVTQVVAVPNLPSVYFTWNPEITCDGGLTSFFGTSGNPIVAWYWDFGDGNISNMQNPVHLYIAPGIYTVSLAVTDMNGCNDTAINQLTIADLPDVDFTFDPDPTCLGSITNFYGLSTAANAVTSWSWDFGDGGVGFTQDVTHTYSSVGNYTVSLMIEDTSGCTNSISYPVIVNPLPTADFNTSAPSCNNDSVYFFDVSSTPNGWLVEWIWNFGDGSSQTINYPDDPNISHLYPNPGTFQVTLSINDSESCTNSTIRNVNVITSPLADFTYSSACEQQLVSFTDLSSPNGGSNLISWYWEFGDPASGVSNISNLQNPSHLFTPGAGPFSVSLVVMNVDGCSDSIAYPVSLNPLPDVDINASPLNTIPGDSIQFSGISNAPIVSWDWDFDDGNFSVLQNPIHSYQTIGAFAVQLTVTDVNGCENSAIIQVSIGSPPIFPEDSAIWNIIGDNVFTSDTWRFRYGIIGDTLINITDLDTSYTYSKVYSLYDSTLSGYNASYFAAIRNTEDGKVFILMPEYEECLLYDFSLEVGDTAWYSVGGGLCYNDVEFWEEEHYKVVTGIDSILLENGQYRKKWNLESEFMNDAWVGGIGSIEWYGLFNPLISAISLCGDNYGVACIKDKETVLYLNNPLCEECFCSLLTDIKDPIQHEENDLILFPNPASEMLTISISYPMVTEVLIYNSLGNAKYSKNIDSVHGLSIDVSDWKKGFYVLIARTKNRELQARKFVVQ